MTRASFPRTTEVEGRECSEEMTEHQEASWRGWQQKTSVKHIVLFMNDGVTVEYQELKIWELAVTLNLC